MKSKFDHEEELKLWDVYASIALIGMAHEEDLSCREVAECCGFLADAMLEERKKRFKES